MHLSDFDYTLPEELIAISPAEKRDGSKLLIFHDNNIQDKFFYDLPDYLNQNDLLVLNNTRVIPARISGYCKNCKAEITLIKKIKSDNEVWQVLAKPGKRLIVGEIFFMAQNFFAKVISKKETGEITLQFNKNSVDFFKELEKHGTMPLPPYIAKKRKASTSDNITYQTTYAKRNGSVAAPTAGLHFTNEVMERLEEKNIKKVFVTLHVGAGTFFPIRVEDINDHKMHSEWYDISKEAADQINETKKNGGRIIAVGTTSLRVLESVSDENGWVQAQTGETNIFIKPGYKFKIVDCLLTNFHLPKSTLFILVSAFLGLNNIKKIYSHAISSSYKFFSYGDSSLLIRPKNNDVK